jgi:hypothetical protein
MARFRILLMVLLALGAAQDASAQWRCRDRDGRQRCEDERRRRREEGRRDEPGPILFGVRGGYDFEEEAGVAGAQFRVPLVRWATLSPSFDVIFSDSDTQWQASLDALFRPYPLGGFYGGGGLAILHGDFDDDDEDSDTEVGYNLLVGLEGRWISHTSIQPFVEGRWTQVSDHNAFRLVVGLNVPVAKGFKLW